MASQRPGAARQCCLAYASALLVGIASGWLFQDRGLFEDPFWLGFAVTCAATVSIWIFSIPNGNSSIHDPYWVIAPPTRMSSTR